MTHLSSYELPAVPHGIPVPAYLRGFQTLDAETSMPTLPVQGRIPRWLTGTLLRIGPARFEWGPDRYRHWFDGSGMIHKFSFAGGSVGYAGPGAAGGPGGVTTRMPSSASVAGGTGVGAPVSGSAPDCVLGYAITSRMFSSPARIAAKRSIPNANPAWGGAP